MTAYSGCVYVDGVYLKRSWGGERRTVCKVHLFVLIGAFLSDLFHIRVVFLHFLNPLQERAFGLHDLITEDPVGFQLSAFIELIFFDGQINVSLCVCTKKGGDKP